MSGVYALAVSSIAPAALITGLSIEATKRYRPQTWVGWIIVIVGFGLTSTLLATDTLAKSIGYFLMTGFGTGCVRLVARRLFTLELALIHGSVLNATQVYPIQAPLPVTQNAPALAFMWFVSSFAAVSIPIPFYPIPTPSLTSWCASSVGMGYHDRGHRRPERARKEASCIAYPICPTRDCHHVRAHPRAPHISTGD